MLRDIIEKTFTTLSTTGSEGEHTHPQYRGIGLREAPPELWRWRDTDRELPAMDRVMVDIIQATAKMTGLEKRMMFHIDPGTQQYGDRDNPRWQRRPACDWDDGIWSSSPLPASHLTKINDLHGRINTQLSRDAMIQEPESDGMNRS